MISSMRRSAMENPFIVFDFFDVIKDIINKHNIPPRNIWNFDESGYVWLLV